MRNRMTPETFHNMIFAHNKTMHNMEIFQVNNVWEIDDEIDLNYGVKKQLRLRTIGKTTNVFTPYEGK